MCYTNVYPGTGYFSGKYLSLDFFSEARLIKNQMVGL